MGMAQKAARTDSMKQQNCFPAAGEVEESQSYSNKAQNLLL